MSTESGLRSSIEGAILPPPAQRKALRLGAGLTVTDAARVVGCARLTIYRWEANDGVKPTGELRRRYGGFLDACREAIAGRADGT